MIQRKDELERLYDAVIARENLYLSAPAGMGKSYLVSQLSQKLIGRRFCFSINLRGLQTNRQILHRLLSNLKREAENSYNLQYQLKRILEERPVPLEIDQQSLSQWLENLLVGLQNVSLDFLFIVEDVDQWEGHSPIDQLFSAFHHSRNSQVLLTAVRYREMESFRSIRLLPLSSANIEESGLPGMNEALLQEYLTLSGGNTQFFLELVGEGLTKNPNDRLENVLEQYHDTYYNFRQRFTLLQWRLLLAIAAEGRVSHPHAFEFLINYRLGAASSVERALRNLSDSGIIRQDNQGWQVSQIRFQRWLEWLYPQNVEALSLQ